MNVYSWIFFLISCSIYSLYKESLYATASHPAQWAHYLSLGQEPRTNFEAGFDLHDEDMRKFHIWPLGIIPYYIDDFSFDKVLRDRIRHQLDNINRVTGLRFLEIPRPPEDDKSRWVFFLNRNGRQDCADIAFKNFTNEGVQRIVLGYNCLSGGDIAEVVLSLVGVPPQHNAPNRDNIIVIHTNNIFPDKRYLFDALKDDEWLFHKMDYDLESAGHYLPHQYTKNGAATITIKEPKKFTPQHIINPRSELSLVDIQKIKSLYNYISRNRETPSHVPGCNKLFEVGSNFSSVKPLEDRIKPLKKPSQCLGISKENASVENEVAHKDDISKENIGSKETNVSLEANASEESNASKEIYTSEEDKAPIEENKSKESDGHENNKSVNTDKTNEDKRTTDNQSSKVINVTRNKKESFLLHSKKGILLGQPDYTTSEERPQDVFIHGMK